jgi:3',5'-cyclic AMP phosphodiesterase CpdA
MRIALVSDSHLAQAANALNDNWNAIRRFVAEAGIDLTIHLGDITVDGADDPAQYQWARHISADWPGELRFLPGNHDIGDNPPAPGTVVDQPLTQERLARYRAAFGADYWTIDLEPWRLIGLNAQLMGSGLAAETEQWDWLCDRAGEAGERPVVLMLHKPLCRVSLDETAPSISYVPATARRRLLQAMAIMDVRAVLSGHRHQHLDRVIGGVRHVWLPSTAFYLPDSIQDRLGEKVTGLAVLELGENELRCELVCPDGVQRHDILDHPIYPEIEHVRTQLRAAIG